jgi:hypothetical protein
METYLIGLNILSIGVIAILIRGAYKLSQEVKFLKGFSGCMLAFTAKKLNVNAEALQAQYNEFIKEEMWKKRT